MKRKRFDLRMTLKHSQSLFETLAPAGYYVALRVGYSFPEEEMNCLNQDWIEEYTQRGLFVHDPSMRWIYGNQGAIRWSELTLPDPAGRPDPSGVTTKSSAATSSALNGSPRLGRCWPNAVTVVRQTTETSKRLNVDIIKLAAVINPPGLQAVVMIERSVGTTLTHHFARWLYIARLVRRAADERRWTPLPRPC